MRYRLRGNSPKAADCTCQSFFVSSNQLVPGGVRLLVNQFARGIGVEPRQRPPNAFGKACGGAVAENKALDLCVVEDNAKRLVTEQAAFHFGEARDNEIGGDVHQFWLDSRRRANDP